MTTTTVHKTSISIKQNLRKKLEKTKNRSDFINKALQFYFEKEELLEKTEKNFLYQAIKPGLEDIKSGEVIALNPNDEEITEKLIQDVLWS